MDKMTQEQWDAMTAADRAAHIVNTPWKIDKRSGLNGNAKVGSNLKDAVVTQYAVISGGVQISGWHESQIDSVKEALSSSEGYIEAADHEQEVQQASH